MRTRDDRCEAVSDAEDNMEEEIERVEITWSPREARRVSRRESERVMSFWWEERREFSRVVREDSRAWRVARMVRISEGVVAEGA